MKYVNMRGTVRILMTVLISSVGAVVLGATVVLEARAKYKDELVERSIHAYREITLSTIDANVVTDELSSYKSGGRRESYLSVAIHPTAHRGGAVFIWNRDATRLERVSTSEESPPSVEPKPFDAVYAANLTSRWLRVLGIALDAPQWKLVGELDHHVAGRYSALWRARDRDVTIVIQDQTGQLLLADVARHSQTD